MRTEPCVCGGLITVRAYDHVDVAVRRHNMSVSHVLWRWDREASTATSDTVRLVTVSRCASAPPGRFS